MEMRTHITDVLARARMNLCPLTTSWTVTSKTSSGKLWWLNLQSPTRTRVSTRTHSRTSVTPQPRYSLKNSKMNTELQFLGLLRKLTTKKCALRNVYLPWPHIPSTLISMFIMVIMKAESQAMSIISTVTYTGRAFVYPGITTTPRTVIEFWAIPGTTTHMRPCDMQAMVLADCMVW